MNNKAVLANTTDEMIPRTVYCCKNHVRMIIKG